MEPLPASNDHRAVNLSSTAGRPYRVAYHMHASVVGCTHLYQGCYDIGRGCSLLHFCEGVRADAERRTPFDAAADELTVVHGLLL